MTTPSTFDVSPSSACVLHWIICPQIILGYLESMRLGSIDRKRLYKYTLVYSIIHFSSYSKSVLHPVGLSGSLARDHCDGLDKVRKYSLRFHRAILGDPMLTFSEILTVVATPPMLPGRGIRLATLRAGACIVNPPGCILGGCDVVSVIVACQCRICTRMI